MATSYELFLGRFGEFTEIQTLAFKAIESGKNCLIIAPTGSGKTEAAFLPVLNKIAVLEKGKIYALYVTPLRALNRDLIKRLEWICGAVGVDISVRHGDTTQTERRRQVEKPAQVFITTPETLQNMLLSAKLKEAFSGLKFVIVDEVHELYSNKRGVQLSVALERLGQLADFKRIGVSATIGDVRKVQAFLFNGRESVVAQSLRPKEFRFTVEMPSVPTKRYSELADVFKLDDKAAARIERIEELVRGSSSTIIFANTRQAVESLGSKLTYMSKVGHFESIGIHHSSISKEERIVVENMFKEARLKAIIATSSLELGIDIGRVNLVVQYGSPRQTLRLIQRVGRGGHREGILSNGAIIVSSALECMEAVTIADAATKGILEQQDVEENALDVLLNQICSMVLEYRKMKADDAFKIITGAYPYRNLKREDFDRVAKLASDLRIIKYDGEELNLGARSRTYFIKNISVIPDSVRFQVKNAATNRIISTLDEKFVYSNIDEGSSIITKGLPWKVLSIEKDVVFVEPSDDIEAAIPDWEGEDIPVTYNIATAVQNGIATKAVGLEGFMDVETLAEMRRFSENQKEHFLPSEDLVAIEELDNYTVIHVCLGKLANEYLSRMISAMLVPYGGRFGVKSTPYSIIIDANYAARRPDFRKLFEILKTMDDINNPVFVKSSDLFRYKFVQTAKLFGVVEKDAKITKGSANRIINFYNESPIFNEVMRDLNKNYFDVGNVRRFIERLRGGRIKVIEFGGWSPLAMENLKSIYFHREFLSPNMASDDEIESMKGVVKDRRIELLCTFCGFRFDYKIDVDKDKETLCARCKSPLVVISSKEYETVVDKKLKKKQLNYAEARTNVEIQKEASLLSAYGNRAIIALSTYGVGIDTAAKVLKFVRGTYRMFFVDVLTAKKQFIRNRKFWKMD